MKGLLNQTDKSSRVFRFALQSLLVAIPNSGSRISETIQQMLKEKGNFRQWSVVLNIFIRIAATCVDLQVCRTTRYSCRYRGIPYSIALKIITGSQCKDLMHSDTYDPINWHNVFSMRYILRNFFQVILARKELQLSTFSTNQSICQHGRSLEVEIPTDVTSG